MARYLDLHGLETFWAKIKAILTGITSQLTSLSTTVSTLTNNLADKAPNIPSQVTIDNGDKLVITDASDSDKIKRASTSFDGSTTRSFLTQKGTFGRVLYADEAWGGTFRTNLSPFDNYAFKVANVFLGAKPSALRVEYSNDGGTTWTDYGLTDEQKIGLFSQYGTSSAACGHNLHIHPGYTGTITGTKDLSNDNIADQRLRITICTCSLANEGTTGTTDTWLYCNLRRIGIYMSTQSAGLGAHCLFEKRTGANFKSGTDTWVTVGDYKIQGDSGWNSIPCGNDISEGAITFGNSDGQYREIRFTIWSDSLTASPHYAQTGNLTIYKVVAYAELCWTSNTSIPNIGKYGTPYTINPSTGVTSFDKGITSGVAIPISSGGTGATTASAAANTFLSSLPDWTANPSDTVKLIRRDTNDGATFGQVTFLTVWNYIKGKISSVLGLSESNGVKTFTGNAASADNATNATNYSTNSGNYNIADAINGRVNKTGDTMSGRLTLQKPLNQIITGTGLTASSSGTPKVYYPARWKFDLNIANPTPGDKLVIKLPCAGHDYGCFISTDNGTTYYPVARHTGATRLTTHYPNGAYICVVFEAYVSGNVNSGEVDSVYPPEGGTARQNYTSGCWRIINDYDANSTYSGFVCGYCSTAAGTAQKDVTATNYSACTGNTIMVRFTNTNSASGEITLNAGGQNYPIVLNGVLSTAGTTTALPAGTWPCYFDGSYWHIWTNGIYEFKKLYAEDISSNNVINVGSTSPSYAELRDKIWNGGVNTFYAKVLLFSSSVILYLPLIHYPNSVTMDYGSIGFGTFVNNTFYYVTYSAGSVWSNIYSSNILSDSSLTAGTDISITSSGGSLTIGVDTTGTRTGVYSFVEGQDTTASGSASHAEGYNTQATSYNTHAEGFTTSATNNAAHAEGSNTTASGDSAHAEGRSGTASGKQAHAEGYDTLANGETSHAEGSLTKAFGTSAHAEGGATEALGKDAHAEGLRTRVISGSTACHAEGYASALGKTTAEGTGTHAEGYDCIAKGYGTHAEGYGTSVNGNGAHAEGYGTEASGTAMHAAGMYNSTTSGVARVTGWGTSESKKDIEVLSTTGQLTLGAGLTTNGSINLNSGSINLISGSINISSGDIGCVGQISANGGVYGPNITSITPLVVVPGKSAADGNPTYTQIWNAARDKTPIFFMIFEGLNGLPYWHRIPVKAYYTANQNVFFDVSVLSHNDGVVYNFSYSMGYDSSTNEAVWYYWYGQQGSSPSYVVMPSEGITGTPVANYTANRLATSRSLKVSLGSTSSQSFDGSADATSIGVSGTLPVARGGTGITSNPSLKVDLESTSTASVFTASPRPGVTGTLGVENGGTGVTSNPSMKTNLGSTSAASVFASSPRPGVTGTLGVGNGGTGKTTYKDALNELINSGAGIGTSPAYPADYVVAQYADGGTSTTTYHRRRADTIATSPYRKSPATCLGWDERVLTVKSSMPENWDGTGSQYYWTYTYKDFMPFRTLNVNSTDFSDLVQSCVRWFRQSKTVNIDQFQVGVSFILVLMHTASSTYNVKIKNNTSSTVTFYMGKSASVDIAAGENFDLLMSGPNTANSVLWNQNASIKILFRQSSTSCYVYNTY